MKTPDWKKAPKGATHYETGTFYKIVNDSPHHYRVDFGWRPSVCTIQDVQRMAAVAPAPVAAAVAPNWKEAPEGATHWSEGAFYKIDELGEPQFYTDHKWTLSACTHGYVQRMETKPEPEIVEWMPVVAVKCEFLPDPGENIWVRCIFLAHVDGEYFVDVLEGQSYDKGVDRMPDRTKGRFRPIKSKEDKAIDEMLSLVTGKALSIKGMCKALYKAGYKLNGTG